MFAETASARCTLTETLPMAPLPSQGEAPRATSRMELVTRLSRLLPELRARALRLCKDDATADDLVQDTAERALKFQAQYQQGSNVRAWLHQILFSVFITRCRRQRRERNALSVLGSDPCAWTQPEAFVAPDKAQGLTKGTSDKLHGLPSTFRQVVVLVDLEDCSYREAAVTLGVPVGTVMSRLHRGRKLLATAMSAAA